MSQFMTTGWFPPLASVMVISSISLFAALGLAAGVVKREDARTFLEWRLMNGLSLSRAADALGLSRRMVAYYSNAEKRVPRTVLLACRGWDANNRVSSDRSSPVP